MRKIKNTGKKMSIEDLAGIIKNSFDDFEKRTDEKFELADKKIDDFRTEVNGRFADINGKFFETKDQLNLLQNKMVHVEKLFDNNDAEHKLFQSKIGRLEKVK